LVCANLEELGQVQNDFLVISGDKASSNASNDETWNFSSLNNEQKSIIRNFSRFENEPTLSKSRNFPSANQGVELNARDISRIENERPHAPLPRVIDVGNEVRRETVDRREYDRFPVSDASNRRGSDRGYDKRPESEIGNISSSGVQREMRPSTIQTEAPSSIFNPASSEALLVSILSIIFMATIP